MSIPVHADIRVIHVNPTQLKPYEHNARTHSKKQVGQIADSIRQFGFNNPVLVDKDNIIIAGHGRVQAAIKLGLESVPTLQIGHLSDAQKRAYILADNRLAEKAGWDKAMLAIEFQYLDTLELDFNLDITGFDAPEIDLLLQGEEEPDDDDRNIPPLPANPITQLGDLWQLGDHLIYCGNSLEKESYERLMATDKAAMVFTDPPYNVPINGHVSGNGRVKHEEFAMASGEMSEAQFVTFLRQACQHMMDFSSDGSLHFIFMDWRHIRELLEAGSAIYQELKNICVWNKNRGGMGSLYRSKHEMAAVFKHGSQPHINNIKLGRHGRNRTNVWDYPAVNPSTQGPDSELAMHPTVKPIRMIADAMLDCSNRGDIILDPFGGSGSTLMAAQKTKRKARLIELDAGYVDTTILRWQRKTRMEAIHIESGQTFAERRKANGGA